MCPSENSASVRAGAQCPLSEVPLYCVSEMGSSVLSVLRVREVSVSGGFLYSFYFGTRVSVRFTASVRSWEVSVNGGSTVLPRVIMT